MKLKDAAKACALVYNEHEFDVDGVQWNASVVGNRLSIVIAGTNSPKEHLSNAQAIQRWSILVPRVQVHRKFENDAAVIVDTMSSVYDFRNYKLWIMGHSRGGAVAQILAAYVASIQRFGDFSAPHIVSFESPRAGDWRLRRFMRKHIEHHTRVVRAGDPVPLMPLWPHYWHDRPPLYIDNDGSIGKMPLWRRILAFPIHMSLETHDMNTIVELIPEGYDI